MPISSDSAGSDSPAVAVLPFDVLEHEPSHPYLGDAIAEEVITTLSRIPQLRVIARGSSFQYRESVPDLATIGRELDVRYVLQGSVRTAGNRVRVTAHLGEVSTGAEVWADRYDRDLDDVFAVQDEISSEIATTLEVKLGFGEQVRFWRRGQRSLEAYEHFARYNEEYLKFSRSANRRARNEALAAIELDPEFTSALVALGSTYATEAHLHWSEDRGESLRKAREAAERALVVEGGFPEATALMGRILMLEGSYEEAIATTGRALEDLPNYAWGYHLQAMNLLYAGRFAEAVEADRQVFLLSPLSNVQSDNARLYMAIAYCHLGRYEDALEELAQVLERHPSWQMARTQRIVALVGTGDLVAARDDARALLRINPKFSTSWYAALNSYKNAVDLQNMLGPLQAVGLPEQPGQGDLLGDDTKADSPTEIRRELATVLFTDIVESTRMAAEIGDRRWREILDGHDEMARSIVSACRGQLVKSTGDGILAMFDRPSDAVRCASEMLARADGLGLELRAGIHTGEVEMRSGDVAGIAVHVAARVAAESRASEIMLSRTVRELIAGSDYSTVPIGLVELKGVPEAVELYSIEH